VKVYKDLQRQELFILISSTKMVSSYKTVTAFLLLTVKVLPNQLCITSPHTDIFSQQAITALTSSKPHIAATSWGSPRVDIFGIAPDKTIWHKYDLGSPAGWQPSSGFENMKATAFFYPSVVSWGQNRLDYFHIGKENAAHHKYWDGSQWVRPPPITYPLGEALLKEIEPTRQILRAPRRKLLLWSRRHFLVSQSSRYSRSLSRKHFHP
jgi:hypothetical protein